MLELRNVNEKTTSFALIDLDLSEVRWHVQPPGTDWWTTLTAFSGDLVYLHNYRNPELPEPSDLVALSKSDGESSWVLPNHVFVRKIDDVTIEVANKGIIGIKKVLYNVEIEPREVGAGYEKANSKTIEILQVPVRYTVENQYYSDIASFVHKIVGIMEVVAFDYLECDPFLVLSYYIYEHDEVAQYLIIVNRDKKVLLHERIAKGLKGVGRDTFLLKGKVLVYLRNNNEFVSLKLTPYNEVSD